jgi:hypothetical protein
MYDINKLDEIIIGGIDPSDYPDFCDSYIESATYEGVIMTYKQLDELNEQESSFVNEYALLDFIGA